MFRFCALPPPPRRNHVRNPLGSGHDPLAGPARRDMCALLWSLLLWSGTQFASFFWWAGGGGTGTVAVTFLSWLSRATVESF